MNFEDELKAALSRKDPSADFAGRVIKKLSAGGVARAPRYRAIAAAVIMTAVIGGWTALEIHHRREGERAREEVLTALRITSEKLRTAQQHVHDIGSER